MSAPRAAPAPLAANPQRTHGNQAVLRVLASQRRAAEAARSAEPGGSRGRCACGGTVGPDGECAACRARQATARRTSATGTAPPIAPPIVHDVLRSSGRPLDVATRAFQEVRFGRDFGRVRIHTDARAAASARVVQALAYTVGSDIVFGAGQFAPATPAGRRLLAHELTHVAQQGGRRPTEVLGIASAHDPLETEAAEAAERVAAGTPGGALSSIRPRPDVPIMVRRQTVGCPPQPVEEPRHAGSCPEIARAPGELERANAAGQEVVELAPVQCVAVERMRSNRAEFGRPPELMDLANLLFADATVRLEIVGYTDCVGSAALNADLRWRRARAVATHLVAELGVDPARLAIQAAPATAYIAANATPEGRDRNRGVTIGIMHPPVARPPVAAQPSCQPPYDVAYTPSSGNCAIYEGPAARRHLTWTYRRNARCACETTPNDPKNNCVRKCLQDKFSTFLSSPSRREALESPCLDPFGALDFVCPEPHCHELHRHHVDCYRDCCCPAPFIPYPWFWFICEGHPISCRIVGESIRAFNACEPPPEAQCEPRYLGGGAHLGRDCVVRQGPGPKE